MELTSKRLTWMHHPITSGRLQFENLLIVSQSQIILQEEGKACMQE